MDTKLIHRIQSGLRISLFITLSITIFCPVLAASIHYVPGNFNTVLNAYVAADSGDTLIVKPGTYSGEGWTDIIFYVKSVIIMSEEGPATTIINGQGNRKGWGFKDLEDNNMEVTGFSFIDCVGYEIGAVNFHKNSPVTMRNCVIIRGKATRDHPEGEGEGGGIRIWGSSPTITDCIIQDCMASQGGGFSLLENANPVIKRCVITNSRGTGIMMAENCDPLIEDCQLTDNEAAPVSYAGGMGIYANSNAVVNRCLIAGNVNNHNGGGGMRIEDSSPTITNTYIIDNTTIRHAGGVLLRNSAFPKFYNCTITGNTAMEKADGVGSFFNSIPEFYNCIIWHPDWEFYFESNGSMYAEYCDTSVDLSGAGVGNFTANPLFTGEDDYHLTADSPCIDTGFDYNVLDDYDSEIRPLADGFDVGADEYSIAGEISVQLEMPAHAFWPGDLCYLNAICTNSGPGRNNLMLFVVLGVYGDFFFWPSWGSFDFEVVDLPLEEKTVPIIPEFNWPENAGNADHIFFYSALMNALKTELYGELASWEFRWSDDPSTKPTPTQTPVTTPTPSQTQTATPSVTPTASPTMSPSPTTTPTDTPTITPTNTPTMTPTNTPTYTATVVPTGTTTETPTSIPTSTYTPTGTPTPNPDPTSTSLPTNTPQSTASPEPTITPEPSSTP